MKEIHVDLFRSAGGPIIAETSTHSTPARRTTGSARQGGLDQSGIPCGERIEDANALDASAILKVFADQQLDPNAPHRRPQERIPK
jgi:hypothetical protein